MTTAPGPSSFDTEPPGAGAPARPALYAVLLAVIVFAAIAPTLGWLEFSGGMENVTIASSIETASRPDDPKAWLLPTLNGEPRLRKPPLVHWVTAAGIVSGGPIEWGARWPTLAGSCLLLIAIYALARTIGGDARLALCAACIAASTFLFFRYSRQAQYDPWLALFVVSANACIARVLFHGRWWSGCLGAGLFLALALLSKGPVALVQSIVPAAAFVAFLRATPPGLPLARPGVSPLTKAAAVLAGLLV